MRQVGKRDPLCLSAHHRIGVPAVGDHFEGPANPHLSSKSPRAGAQVPVWRGARRRSDRYRANDLVTFVTGNPHHLHAHRPARHPHPVIEATPVSENGVAATVGDVGVDRPRAETKSNPTARGRGRTKMNSKKPSEPPSSRPHSQQRSDGRESARSSGYGDPASPTRCPGSIGGQMHDGRSPHCRTAGNHCPRACWRLQIAEEDALCRGGCPP